LGLLPIATNWSIAIVNRTIEHGGMVASYWVPLASAIVWGLAFATVLTLLVTPCMLLLPKSVREQAVKLRQLVALKMSRS